MRSDGKLENLGSSVLLHCNLLLPLVSLAQLVSLSVPQLGQDLPLVSPGAGSVGVESCL